MIFVRLPAGAPFLFFPFLFVVAGMRSVARVCRGDVEQPDVVVRGARGAAKALAAASRAARDCVQVGQPVYRYISSENHDRFGSIYPCFFLPSSPSTSFIYFLAGAMLTIRGTPTMLGSRPWAFTITTTWASA